MALRVTARHNSITQEGVVETRTYLQHKLYDYMYINSM